MALAESREGLPLHRLALADMQAIEPRITEDVFTVLSVDRSVRSRTSEGGTAPANVRRAARRWLKRLERLGQAGDSVDGAGEGGFTPAARSA